MPQYYKCGPISNRLSKYSTRNKNLDILKLMQYGGQCLEIRYFMSGNSRATSYEPIYKQLFWYKKQYIGRYEYIFGIHLRYRVKVH